MRDADLHIEKTKGLFVTGSGTGVGKTYISGMLLEGFARLGRRVTYMKPVETGCRTHKRDTGHALMGNDARGMLDVSGCVKTDIDLHSPYRFAPACSPHLAARLAGCDIRVDDIVSAYENLCRETAADIVIAEGAGGILAPITHNADDPHGRDKYIADVISALKMTTILVTGPELGTLNHTFLSLSELTRRGITVAGVVINDAKGIERDFIFEDNVNEIMKYVTPAPCLVVYYNDNSNNTRITEFCKDVLSRV